MAKKPLKQKSIISGLIFFTLALITLVAALYTARSGNSLFLNKGRADSSFEIFRNVTYATKDDTALTLDICKPKNVSSLMPAVMLVHGGGWAYCTSSTYTTPRFNSTKPCEQYTNDWCQKLAQNYIVGISINYRLNAYPAQTDDLQTALNWIKTNSRKYLIDPEKIAGWGESSGANLVSLMGVKGQFKAVVDEYGPQNLTLPAYQAHDLMGPLVNNYASPSATKRLASPILNLTSKAAPLLAIHGTTDTVVPLSESQNIVTALKAQGTYARLITYTGGHGLPSKVASDIFSQELRFVQHFLSTNNKCIHLANAFTEAVYKDGKGYIRSVPLTSSGDINWSKAGSWNSVTVNLDGSGTIEAQSSLILPDSQQLMQSYWRNKTGYYRYVPIENGKIIWSKAKAWNSNTLNGLEGEGAVQAQSDVVTPDGSQLIQGYWRSNVGYLRSVPIINNQPSWSTAKPWSRTSINLMPGSGDVRAQAHAISPNGKILYQFFARGNQVYRRTVPIENHQLVWDKAGSWADVTTNYPGATLQSHDIIPESCW
jgi:acetyl esterase/lipase